VCLSVRQEAPDLNSVPTVNKISPSETPLPLGGFARQNVAVISLLALYLATLENGKPFGRASARLYFLHDTNSRLRGGPPAPYRNPRILNFFLYLIRCQITNLLHNEENFS
jgi:hypothetical protein